MAKVAVLLGDMFEDSEFRVPYDRLVEAGHQVLIVGVEAGEDLRGKQGSEQVTAEASARDVSGDDFDALFIPGGYSPDHLRTDDDIVRFVTEIFSAGKLVGAVCHGPSLLVDADVLDGRTVTSWPSIKADLLNAGADWVDREVVEDGPLITSRKPDDLEAFCDVLLERLEQLDERAERRPEPPPAPGP